MKQSRESVISILQSSLPDLPKNVVENKKKKAYLYAAIALESAYFGGKRCFISVDLDLDEKLLKNICESVFYAMQRIDLLSEPTREFLKRKVCQRLEIDGLERKSYRLFQWLEDISATEKFVARKGHRYNPDWSAAAIAGYCGRFWEIARGEQPPRTAHADSPGPFGRFLRDILEAIVPVYRPESEAPSARSALRALEGVTKRGGKLDLKW